VKRVRAELLAWQFGQHESVHVHSEAVHVHDGAAMTPAMSESPHLDFVVRSRDERKTVYGYVYGEEGEFLNQDTRNE
jgi:hypothetical protein